MSKRIAVLFEYPSVNGGENSMLQAMRVIDSNAFGFVAIAPPTGHLADALADQGIEHIPFSAHDDDGHKLLRTILCKQLIATITRVSPDLVHANSLSMGRISGAVHAELPVPCTAHLRDIMNLSRAAINDINANARIVAVSHATRDFHLAQGLSAHNSCVVHNAVDCERFSPRAATGSLRRELGLPAKSVIALTIGQIGLRKAQDVIADAAPLITSSVEHIHFLIVGMRNSSKAESIVFEEQIAATFKRHGLADRLHFLSYRDDVDQLMNEADLLIHPAKQEPFGRVLLEAAAAGLPIVATDVGGTKEILTDRESASLVSAGDVEQLAEAVIELANSAPLQNRYAHAARQTIRNRFDANKTGSGIGAVWQRVIDQSIRKHSL